jgi:hypothetical protein
VLANLAFRIYQTPVRTLGGLARLSLYTCKTTLVCAYCCARQSLDSSGVLHYCVVDVEEKASIFCRGTDRYCITSVTDDKNELQALTIYRVQPMYGDRGVGLAWVAG